VGNFPEMILKAHKQYIVGKEASTGYSMCPIGQTASFCVGWNYGGNLGGNECGNQNQPDHLIGCPLDYMKSVAGFPALSGKWNFVNETSGSMDDINNMTGISGTITFGKDGSFTQTISTRSGSSDYAIQGSWGSDGHILTECFIIGCTKLTFTTISPNHMELTDLHGDTIHLKR
jgi:hypothetical protein